MAPLWLALPEPPRAESPEPRARFPGRIGSSISFFKRREMKTMRWFLAGIGAVSLGSLALAAGGGGQTAPAGSDLHERRRPDPVQELHVLPSAGRNRTDVASDLRRRPAVCQGHPRRGQRGTHATVARGGAERDVPQRTRADRRGKEGAPRVGEHGRTEGRPEGFAADARLSRGLGHRHAGSRVRDAGGVHGPGRRRDRVRGTSTSRPTSPNRSGSRRSSCGRATAKSCTTRSPSTGPRPT